jgi:uncharacterized protein
MKYVAILLVTGLAFFHGHPAGSADFDKGATALNHSDFLTARKEWEPLAEAGHAQAQSGLAYLYTRGLGVPQDLSMAFRLYAQSAKQGLAEAQAALAGMYFLGEGTRRDIALGVKWLQRASDQNFAPAQLALAMAHLEGQGVEKNANKAFQLTNLVAQQKGTLSLTASGKSVVVAQRMLGLFYANGIGTEQDLPIAFIWLERAAHSFDPQAAYEVGVMYREGRGVEKDESKAIEYLEPAASDGIADAQYLLGLSYAEGRGTPRDLEEAVRWLTIASHLNQPKAPSALAEIEGKLSPDELAYAKGMARTWIEFRPKK